MDKQGIAELYRIALIWTDGDGERARALVESYLAGYLTRKQGSDDA